MECSFRRTKTRPVKGLQISVAQVRYHRHLYSGHRRTFQKVFQQAIPFLRFQVTPKHIFHEKAFRAGLHLQPA